MKKFVFFLQVVGKSIAMLVEFFFALLSVYMLLALVGMGVQVGDNYQADKGTETVEIFIRTDGIHTDFLLPVRTKYHQWGNTFPYQDVKGTDTTWFSHISVGWGDQGFFLHTPTWADLTFSTAFDALFYRGKSALHICYQQKPQENFICKRLVIQASEYKQLITYVLKTANCSANQSAHVIPESGYYDYDAFYEANGKYSLFSTCNSWINGGLKEADLPACWWTPLSFAIFAKYE